MKFAKVVTFVGIALLVLAWVLAAFIPSEAEKDFDRLVVAAGGRFSSTPNFPDIYKQMSANRRMLQNFYIGAAGLVCLGAGLSCWKKQVEPSSG
jgi:uncharacterized membrane protein